MPIVPVPGSLGYTPFPFASTSATGGAVAYGTFTLSSAGTRVAIVVEAPKTGTISHLEFRLGTVSQSPVNGLRVSFQALNSTFVPNDTQQQFVVVPQPGGGFAANSWIIPAIMTHDGTPTGTPRSVTVGDRFACVIQFESFVALDNVQVARSVDMDVPQFNSGYFPATRNTNTATAGWTSGAAAAQVAVGALVYTDGSSAWCGLWPFASQSTANVTAGSTINEYGNAFSYPFGYAADGAWIRTAANLNGNGTIRVYDAANNLLVTTGDVSALNLVGANAGTIHVPFRTTQAFAANTLYRIALLAGTAASGGIRVSWFTANRAALFDVLEGGQPVYMTSRGAGGGGAWTDDLTSRVYMGLRLSGIDIPAPSAPLISINSPVLTTRHLVTGY